MEEILIKSLIISLAIVGLRIVSSEGMLLYFLRMPYEFLAESIKIIGEYDFKNKTLTEKGLRISGLKEITFSERDVLDTAHKLKNYYKVGHYLLKPIIGCTTCMASVWTLVIDYYYFDCFNKWTLLTIFVVACLNSIIYAAYEKLNTCNI